MTKLNYRTVGYRVMGMITYMKLSNLSELITFCVLRRLLELMANSKESYTRI